MLSSTYIHESAKRHDFVDVPLITASPALVIFDCDGVLVQSEEITLSLLTDLFNAQRLERCPDQPLLNTDDCIRRFRGRMIKACLDELQDQYQVVLPFYFEAALRVRAQDLYRTDLRATEGVLDLISRLDTCFCVASSAPRSKVEHCLRLTRLSVYH